MARKTKIKRRSTRTQPSTTAGASRVTSQRDLRTIMDACVNHEAKAATSMGNARELIGEYVKSKNLHPQAFSICKRLVRLGNRDPGALWLLLAYLDDYREKLALDKLAKEQTQMLPAGTEEEDDDTNVRRMVPREVEEEAGVA